LASTLTEVAGFWAEARAAQRTAVRKRMSTIDIVRMREIGVNIDLS
jgi:hypothetical protein